jgi:GTP-binding protein
LDQIAQQPDAEQKSEGEHVVYRAKEAKPEFTVRRENDSFIVEGERLEKLVVMTDFSHRDGVERFARIMRQMGVDQALRQKGAENGHTVRIGEFEFDFVE